MLRQLRNPPLAEDSFERFLLPVPEREMQESDTAG